MTTRETKLHKANGSTRITTVAHGRSFEQEVSQWLEDKLNHLLVARNEWIKCANDLKPFECDVHTRASIPYWDKIQRIGVVLLGLGIVFLIAGAAQAQAIAPPFLVFGVLLIVVSRIRKQQRNYHVWIECKNLKTKVNRDHMSKLHATTERLRRNRNAEWRPDFVYCFSATDYERDALSIAKEHNISCYRKSGRGFQQV